MLTKYMKRFIPITTWMATLVVVAGALLLFENDLLWKLQEQNLFLDTSLFFNEQMVVPGGLLSWMGTYLTQFFFYPWLGTLLLCLGWLALMWLTKRTFRVSNQWTALTLVPVALLLITIVDMGYWVYFLKLPGHVFVGTLGTIAVVALLWAFRSLPQRFGLPLIFIVITALVGYPLLGIYGLGATLLMGLLIWNLKMPAWQKITGSVLALAGAAIVPLLCYHLVYHQTNLANIYYAALPLFFVTEEYHAYYLPYYGLALFMVLMVVGEALAKKIKTEKMGKWLPLGTQVLLVAALAWGVWHWWYKDENFHHEIRMQHCIEENDWQGVMDEAALQKDEPTRAIVMMRNLALGRLERQADEMYLYPNGSKRYDAPFDMRLMLVSGPLMYYHYGMINYSARLSTEMGVEFGWRAENLKLLAKCAIVNKEESRARKYLNVLKHTTFFAKWAEEARNMAELKDVARMMHYPNMLSGDGGYVEKFLMNRLAECIYKDDPYFLEQAMLASLYTKDIDQFWYHFRDYSNLHPNDHMPRHFQEAAYLYGMIQGMKNLDQLPFDQSVKQSFDSFSQAAERYNDMDVEYAREGLKAFRHTYYYDYYLMRELPEY